MSSDEDGISSFKPPAEAKRAASSHFKLPLGWKVKLVKRANGKTAGTVDRYFFSPAGTRMRSMTEVQAYIARNKKNAPKQAKEKPKAKKDSKREPVNVIGQPVKGLLVEGAAQEAPQQ